jgi:hypothetical protein
LSVGALAAAREMSVEAHLAALEQVLQRAARASARVKVAASR